MRRETQIAAGSPAAHLRDNLTNWQRKQWERAGRPADLVALQSFAGMVRDKPGKPAPKTIADLVADLV